MQRRARLTRPPRSEKFPVHPPGRRYPVRMDALARLFPVDLPVDVVVILEQQEGAGQAQRGKRALRKC